MDREGRTLSNCIISIFAFHGNGRISPRPVKRQASLAGEGASNICALKLRQNTPLASTATRAQQTTNQGAQPPREPRQHCFSRPAPPCRATPPFPRDSHHHDSLAREKKRSLPTLHLSRIAGVHLTSVFPSRITLYRTLASAPTRLADTDDSRLARARGPREITQPLSWTEPQ